MQLSDMQGRVSARLNEAASGPTFYPLSEITAALNEANRFFVLLTLGLETTAAWAVPAYSSAAPFFHMLQFFVDWICPLRITTTAGAKVRPARLEDLSCLDPFFWASPGSPARYFCLGADLLGLYQQPASTGTTLNVTYCQAPAPLVQAADTPAIPAEYHPRLVAYAIYRCRQVEGGQEFEKSLKYLQDFFEGAKHYARYVRARNKGSNYDKLPFELEKYDLRALLKLRRDLMPNRKHDPAAEPGA